ncbi:GNAT family N-acetyltransferase [Cellulomonas wangleii]|uniref:GNAT family N-acetyltransferase n=1 Tax=Cellulomonas wangleii TaxID=2816956 RepID=UPI0020C01C5F|nr:GNAT family N-acetyltransferase [Cellulomonas wangleii]
MATRTRGDVRLELVAWDDPDATALRTAQQAELRARYGDDDIGHAMTGDSIVAMVVLRVDGEAVACGALRDASDELGPGTGELKRMYVRPEHRGRGLSPRVLTALEEEAARRGLDRLVLETGVLQPEAIGLYLAAGYRPVESYGEYVGVVESRCFAKRLLPRVSVERVDWEHPDAVALRRAMVAELAPLYPEHADDAVGTAARLADDQGTAGSTTFLLRRDGEPVGCATRRDAAASWGPGTAELKRVYVVPSARGRGLSRRLVGLVEVDARARGATRVVLDTGIRQPAALELYLSQGYRPVAPPADAWPVLPVSLWLARDL